MTSVDAHSPIIHVTRREAPRREEVQPQREAPPIEPTQEPDHSSKAIVPITVADLQVIEPGELPRVRDIRLGERLGMVDPQRQIRELVKNNEAELQRYGNLSARTTNSGQRGRPGTEYWLNEAQCILLVMKSNTDAAADARQEIIEVYMVWQHGELQSR
jgi:hypothetical protein